MNAKESRVIAIPLVAADQLTDEEIAARVGVQRNALARWKREPDFAAAVVTKREEITAALKAEGITNKQNRLDALNADFQRLDDLLDARANDPNMAKIPGGTTGLLVREVKYLPGGVEVVRYEYDVAVIKSRMELEKQAAIEMGQWNEKGGIQEPRPSVDVNIQVNVGHDQYVGAFGAFLGGNGLGYAEPPGLTEPLDSTTAN